MVCDGVLRTQQRADVIIAEQQYLLALWLVLFWLMFDGLIQDTRSPHLWVVVWCHRLISAGIQIFLTESLILAQDERWRRA